ncbi:hypothetical protein, partial [Peribacillus frigoritolerans]|uniref:hypothetical protein n=1 Tax=Peribacillus frigoritolerans TaxID=450367 RepID=UPI0039A102DC
KESEHLEGKSTTLHYFVNSNKVCENSLVFKPKLIVTEGTGLLREYASEGGLAGVRPPAESECLQWKSTLKPQNSRVKPDNFELFKV